MLKHLNFLVHQSNPFMASSKAHRFDKLLYEQSIWFKANAHPARIMIITHLLENGKTQFPVLCRNIPLAKETISHHLKHLRREGLIYLEEVFPHSYYSPDFQKCKSYLEKIKPLLQKFDHLIDTRYLKKPKD